MGMSDFFLKWHVAKKELLGLFNLPDSQAGSVVNLMLKKNRHEYNLRFKIADFYQLGKVDLDPV